MSIHRPLYWHQGLFLQPQHFQQNDLRIDANIQESLILTQRYAWGVINQKINEPALLAGQCLFDHLALRFSEGTLVEYPGNAILETRTIANSDFTKGPRVLYVGLRRLMADETNIAFVDDFPQAYRADKRFAVKNEPEMLTDIFGQSGDARLKRMSYILRLFFEDELEHLSEYELLPIVSLGLEGEHLQVMSRYVPPCLNLKASPVLQQTLRGVRDALANKARQLEIFKCPRETQFGDFDITQINHLFVLMILNRYIPQLTHLLESSPVTPWELYSVMRQLVGELSLFSERCDMSGISQDGRHLVPSWRQEESGNGIVALAVLINQLLSDIGVGTELAVRFEWQNDHYSGKCMEGFFDPRHRYYLVIRGASDSTKLINSLLRDGKFCASSELSNLVSRALPGIELSHLQNPPLGIFHRSGAQYFRMESLSAKWDSLQNECTGALFLPDLNDELLIEMVAVRT